MKKFRFKLAKWIGRLLGFGYPLCLGEYEYKIIDHKPNIHMFRRSMTFDKRAVELMNCEDPIAEIFKKRIASDIGSDMLNDRFIKFDLEEDEHDKNRFILRGMVFAIDPKTYEGDFNA